MARIIETEAGTIVGRVDRAARAVVWALTCPGCATELPMGEREFRGQAPVRCGSCGWSSPVYDAQAQGDAPRWYDYETTFQTVPGTSAAA